MYRGDLDWDDARLFLAVVRAGSLRAAGRTLGLSQPTVGRRLARFEAAVSAVPLFDRLPEGLRLTEAAGELVPLSERIEEAALVLQRQRATRQSLPATVRLSVGEWAGGFLTQCLNDRDSEIRVPDGVTLEFAESDQTANLTRREADIAVRHGRPETGDLYVSRVGTIACAAYRVPRSKAPDTAWITYTEEQAHYAAAQWTIAHIRATSGTIAARASSMSLQVIAARAGSGSVILPCYIGDADPVLRRVRPRIDALDAIHWLIVHRDLRRLPIIRGVMDWVSHAFAIHRARLEGATVRRAGQGRV